VPLALAAAAATAGVLDGVQANIVVLGEIHDNPAHHRTEAAAVAALAPRALVFEMLDADQAAQVPAPLPDAEKLADLLDWAQTDWPDFSMYYPIFAAAPQAKIYGAAVPRDAARAAMETGIAAAFGSGAGAYGLTEELGAEELAPRLNLQMEVHCGALPLELLPKMVDIQRLRDARLAEVALEAFDATGGPVAVITGNGHARTDWGVPSYIARVRPEVTVFSLGQSEDGVAPEGTFDRLADAPSVDREDPCAALR
jgi:uncharacterized iron-regulated protein